MDSKSFDLSVEEVAGKLRGFIEGRGRGLSTWIRFGDVNLRCLLDGVEFCYREEDLVGRSFEGEEGGTRFKLDRMGQEGFFFVQW